MKKNILVIKWIFFTLMFSSCQLFATSEDDAKLLNSFHKHGLIKCDSFIIKNSSLEGKGNWNVFISRHNKDIAKDVKEVSAIQIFGSKNDTVKIDYSYIESPNGCFVSKRYTLSFSGSCADTIDGNAWYMSTNMPSKDYNTYKNKLGVEMYAKEITMGNFKACIQEGLVQNNGPLDK